jgi:hypothetical protein
MSKLQGDVMSEYDKGYDDGYDDGMEDAKKKITKRLLEEIRKLHLDSETRRKLQFAVERT